MKIVKALLLLPINLFFELVFWAVKIENKNKRIKLWQIK